MTETSLLQGEITENPHEQELDVEGLLLRFVRALVAEQLAPDQAIAMRVVPSALARAAEPAAAAPPKGAEHLLAVGAPVASSSAATAVLATSSAKGAAVPARKRALVLVRPQPIQQQPEQHTGDQT